MLIALTVFDILLVSCFVQSLYVDAYYSQTDKELVQRITFLPKFRLFVKGSAVLRFDSTLSSSEMIFAPGNENLRLNCAAP
jgi:hypothetical protein